MIPQFDEPQSARKNPTIRKPRNWWIEWRLGAKRQVVAKGLTEAQARIKLRYLKALGREGEFRVVEVGHE